MALRRCCVYTGVKLQACIDAAIEMYNSSTTVGHLRGANCLQCLHCVRYKRPIRSARLSAGNLPDDLFNDSIMLIIFSAYSLNEGSRSGLVFECCYLTSTNYEVERR